MPRVDVIFLVYILLGLIYGFFSNWYRQLLGIIAFVAIFGVFYLFFSDYLTKFLQFDSINRLIENGILKKSLSVYVEQIDTTFHVDSVMDLFLIFQNIGMDPYLLKATCEGLCKAIVIFAGLILSSFGGWLLTTIVYWVILRWIMPKKARKGFVSRLFGGVFGVLTNASFVIILLAISGNFVGAINDSVIVAMQNKDSELVKFVSQTLNVISYDKFASFAPYVQSAANVLDPLNSQSMLVRPIFEILSGMGFNPLKFISVEVATETGDKIREPFRTSFSNFVSELMETGFGKINTLLGK